MAESPEHPNACQRLHDQFQSTSLTSTERHMVWLAINVEHGCNDSVPAHTMIASAQGLDHTIFAALREARLLPDGHLQVLRQFTLRFVRPRGEVPENDVEQFLAAGFARRNVLDILVGLAQKVMSNHVNPLAATPIGAPFAALTWPKPRHAAA